MTTTVHPSRPASNGAKPNRVGLSPTPRRQRSKPAAIGAAVCAVVGMLGFVGIWAASSNRQAVLAVARPVKAGSAIQADDLAIASITDDPTLKPVPASSKANVVGKVAAVDLTAGGLLLDGQLGTPAGIDDGQAVVAVEVPLAGAPLDTLHNGDHVQIVKTSKSGDGKDPLGEVICEGRINAIGRGNPSTGSSVISVIVPQDKAAIVAGASASQRAALVALPQGGS